MKEPALVLETVANLLLEEKTKEASEMLRENYPFKPYEKPLSKRKEGRKHDIPSPITVKTPVNRKYTQKESLELFFKNGFLDQYSGKRLVCPAALYAMSFALPEVFPWSGARVESHQGLWDLFPTVDHVEPVSREGQDVPSNWVTTSMTLNMKKGNQTLTELGWSIYDVDDSSAWDGLVSWYVEFARKNPDVASVPNNKGWHKTTIDVYG